MSNEADVRAGGVYVDIAGRTKSFDDSMDHTESRTADFVNKLRGIGSLLTEIGAKMGLVGAAMAAPLVDSAKAFADYGEAVGKLQAKTGMSSDFLGGLKYAADSSGVAMGAVASAIRNMQKQGLGSTKEDFIALADSIAAIPDPGERAAQAMKTFGRAGVEILPIIENGGAELQRMTREAKILHLALGDEMTENAKKLDESFDRMTGALKGLRLEIGSALYPLLKPLVDRFVDVVVATSDMIKQNPKLVEQWAKIAATFAAVGAGLVALGGAILAITSPALLAAGAIMLIGAAVVGVAGLIGGNDLGFGKMFNSVRIAGVGLGTWLAEIALNVQKIWMMVANDITAAFSHIKQLVDQAKFDSDIQRWEGIAKEMRAKGNTGAADVADEKAAKLRNDQMQAGMGEANSRKAAAQEFETSIRSIEARMKNLFQKDDQGDGQAFGFDPSKLKEGFQDAVDGIWDGLGEQLKNLLGNIPHVNFEDAAKKDVGGPDRGADGQLRFGAVGTFNAFAGSGIGATGIFSEQLSEMKRHTDQLKKIAENTSQQSGLGGN